MDYTDPLRVITSRTEGTATYTALLFIPGSPPYDYYTKEYEKGLALYASGVMIMEKCADLLPDYFSFVKGVVDSEDLSLNISRVNALSDQGGATKAEYELLLQLLNPFAPHMTEELWQQLGHTEQLAYHAWPTYDEAKCVEQTIEIAVQVNGKVKARIKVPAAIENADAIAAAKAEPAVAEAIAGKTIAKEIYVKGKLVNIAVKG